MKYVTSLAATAVAFTLVIGVPASVHGLQPAAQVAAQGSHHQEEGNAGAAVPAPQQHERMMAMMKEMKAADAKLDALVQAMDAAQGAKKTDAVAAVVKALVEQHKTMHGSMAGMMNMMGAMDMKSKP